VTGVLIRALKVPDTLPARYSVVVFAGTGIVVKTVHPDDNIGVLPPSSAIDADSMVTCPAVTGPTPWTLWPLLSQKHCRRV
jgi:hypothetical protein